MAIFNYQGLSKSSGVYVIFNNHNWRIYVGSSRCFKQRWYEHNLALLRNRHSNKFFQSDFNKCREELGHDDFLEFHVLEHLPDSTREQRLIAEEKWIKVHFDKGEQCYNLCERAISREGFGSKDPEETRRKHTEASKKMWENPEYRRRQSEIQSIRTKEQWQKPEDRAKKIAGMLGRIGTPWSDERKQQESSRMKKAPYRFRPKTFRFINPEGNFVEIHNLTEFCRQNPGLERSGLNQLALGAVKSYKGWSNPTI